MLRRRLTALAVSAAVILTGITVGAAPARAIETITVSPSSFTDPTQPLVVTVNGFPTMAANNYYVYWLDFTNMTGSNSGTTCPTFTRVGGTGTPTPNGSPGSNASNPTLPACAWVTGTKFRFVYSDATGLNASSQVEIAFPANSFTLPAGGQYGVTFTAGANQEYPLDSVCLGNCPTGYVAPIRPATITIDIDANGGTCTTAKVSGLEGTWALAPDASSCSRPGGTFTGFNTSADGSGLAIAPGGNLHLTNDNRLYAIYAEPRVPGTPTDVVVVAGRNKVTVSWKAPAVAGSHPITNYLAQATPSGKVCITRQSDADMLSCTFDLPATNTQYSFSVQALNSAGWGEMSAASSAVSPYDFGMIEASRPNVLLGLGGTKVEASGAAPGLAGKAVTAQYKVGSQRDWTTQANAATVNAQGKFSWSRRFGPSVNKQNVTLRFTYGADTVSGTYVLARGGQAGNLSAPRNVKVENVVNRVTVTWDPPKFDGGETIIGYTMCAKGAGSLCRNVSADGRGVFQNLATGRDYTITVAARTASRTGPEATANQKGSPVEASVQITRRTGEEMTVQTRARGFKAGAKFRLEVAVVVFGKPADTWRWEELRSFTSEGTVDRGFTEQLGAFYADEVIAVRLVTPNGSVYSRVSRP